MAARDPQSLRTLLPAVLARLSRERGIASGLEGLWAEVAGPALSRAARPVSVSGDALLLEPAASAWARELVPHLPLLGDRLRERTAGELRVVQLTSGVDP
jgi:hypothetical protein